MRKKKSSRKSSDLSKRAPRVWLLLLGCPKNDVEGDQAMSELFSDGFEPADGVKDADLILINTCAFIQSARTQTENAIASALAKYPRAKIVAIGCYAQRFHEELQQKFPRLSGILGLSSAGNLAKRCRDILQGEKICGDFSIPEKERERPRVFMNEPVYSFIRLGDGCNNNCAYCAIPKIRGKLRSREVSAIIEEAEALDDLDCQELILVAQDTTAYGMDLSPRQNLTYLVEELLARTGIPRLRILYAHPAHITRDLLKLIRREHRLCSYLDMPIQHVNDRILAAMGRRYDRRRLDQIFSWIEKDCPKLVLRSSFIVGFPGETPEEFAELLAFVKTGRIHHLGAFVYSPEDGTRAAKIEPRIDEETAELRRRELMLAQQELFFARQDRRIAGSEIALIDAVAPNKFLYGRSASDAPEIDAQIIIDPQPEYTADNPYPRVLAGDWAPVRIYKRDGYDVRARILDYGPQKLVRMPYKRKK